MITNFLKNRKAFAAFGVFALLIATPIFVHAETGSVTVDTLPTSPALAGTSSSSPGLGQSAGAAVKTAASAAASSAGDFLGKGIALAEGGIAYIMLQFSVILLTLIGTLFNWIVVFTVFKFASYFGNSTGLLFGWGILRDIGNILLLFGFVYLGIMVVLDVHGYDVRKTLPRLIIVAVLLNFSLFAAEAVIDVSNVLSASFFANAGQSSLTCSSTTTNCAPTGISDQIIQAAGFSGITPTAAQLKGLLNDTPHTAGVLMIMALFTAIMCVVLLAASILLAIRAVVLMLVMVTAPVGFVAAAIPQTQGFWDRWLKMLLSQSFFAPVYLLLLYIGLKIMNGLTSTFNPNAATLFAAINGGGANDQSFGIILITFALLIGFMVAALVAAKNMGAVGASFATNTASRAVYGTVTRASNAVVNYGGMRLRKTIQASPFRDTIGARLAVGAIARPLEKANLDQRRVVGGLLRAGGATDGANVASHATLADMQHQAQGAREFLDKNKKEYYSEVNESRLHDEAHHGYVDANGKHQEGLSPEMEEFLNKKSEADLVKNHSIQIADPTVIQALNPEKFESLLKSKDLNDTVKDNIRNARFAEYNTVIANIQNSQAIIDDSASTDDQKKAARKVLADAKNVISNTTKKDFENMPSPILLNPVILDNLSDKMREDLGSSDKRSQSDRQTIKDSSNVEKAKKIFREDGAAAFVESDAFKKLNREQVAKLPKDILTQEAVAAKFTKGMLLKLQDEKFTEKQIADIRENIMKVGSDDVKKYISDQDSPGSVFWS